MARMIECPECKAVVCESCSDRCPYCDADLTKIKKEEEDKIAAG